MIMKIKFGFQLLILLVLAACTPKPQETPTPPIVVEKPVVEKPKKELSPCKNWLSLPEAEQSKVKMLHSIYRDVMKGIGAASDLAKITQEDFDRTFQNWQTVYDIAPAADGERNTHYGDGIKLHEFLASQEKDSLKRDEHIKKVLELYDEVIRCYGLEGFTIGRKAFDVFYKYPEYATDMEKFEMFKRAFDLEGDKAPAFLFNPFTSLIANMASGGKLSTDIASKYANQMLGILKKNQSEIDATKWKRQGWDVVMSYAPARLKTLEGLKGFYDCDYYKEQYYSSFQNGPTDCDSIILVLSRMKWADCSGKDPEVDKVYTAYKAHCQEPPTGPGCRDFLSEGRYQEAIDCYTQKAGESTDPEVKAKYHLFVAKIYYGELKQFSKSRRAALEALKHKPNWGEPYLLIGKLYASSGPLCGSGRGWNSQVVTWPAIDKWQKAKSLDPSVAREANKLIARYRKFMPTVEDIFQRGLKEGQSFRVPCWIQENTTIRTAK